MKPKWPSRIDATSYPDAPDWFKKFLVPLSQMISSLTQMLANGLTFSDNFKASIITVSLTHNVTATITNPLKNVPVGILSISCDSQTVSSLGWSNTVTGLSVTAQFVSGSGTANVILLLIGG